MQTQSRNVSFQGSQAELSARLDLPATPPLAYAIFAHCFTCSKEVRAATYASAALSCKGVAVLRFDFTGLGRSGGEFANTNFSSNVEDLIAAADWLRNNHQAPALLVGHSLGGTAVLAAAARIPETKAVATIGSPFDPAHVLRHLQESIAAIERDGEATVDIAGRAFLVRRQLLEDFRRQDLRDTVAHLGRALLVMHSPRDTTVDIDNAARIFTPARHPKSFVSLDSADHLLSNRDDALYVAKCWPRGGPLRLGGAGDSAVVEGRVLVRETREGKFTNHVIAGRHVYRADEPVAAGGLASGFSPYEYLSAALGACTSMTLRMYADLKKLPLERISVEVKHEKIHAVDCAECETKEGRLDRLERVIRLEGDLDEAQRAKLLEIADKCPVHRTLHSEVVVTSTLAA